MNLHHYQMDNHCQQVSHLHKNICYATAQPNSYHTYQMTLIRFQIHWKILSLTHLTHWTSSILNKHDVRIRNVGVKGATMNLLKRLPRSQPKHLMLHTIIMSQKFKLDEDPLQRRVYLLKFINSLKNFLS